MSRLRLGALIATGAVAALISAGCSSTSGTAEPAGASAAPAAASTSAEAKAASLDAKQAGTAVVAAAKQAKAVHVRGTVSEGGNINLDLQLNPDSASGTIVKDGLEVPVLRVGDKYYFRFSESLIKEAGIPASLSKPLKDKWVPSTSQIGAGMGEAFKQFLDYKTFTDNTIGEIDSATFSGGEQTTAGGVPALNFTSSDGTATVAAAEPHYLLRMQEPKSGTMEFSDWDKPTTVTAPKASEIYSGPGA
ncbi:MULTISPECIES: hypothetical protein [unclassified Amycolatopsis]|uniref:hypothetical protein n=1 Tax=unclassified Amycolatopsis TaxID=2618356 RepID=UPI002E1667AE|nr:MULTISPECIES: hypothetical protein [unclassified Amycolatopsis]WSJ78357.1 hypothetical protein OG439_05050 [Amycolatopsis sp. NBC_01307]